MRVSQRIDYSVRLLVALASLPENERVAVGDLAVALGLPKRFSEQQITELSRDGIVSSQAGAGGGCRLAPGAVNVTIAQVIRTLEGAVLDVPHTTRSAAAEMWERAAGILEGTLESETIGDLARRQAVLDREGAPMYHI
jgi:Rrf2 family protein